MGHFCVVRGPLARLRCAFRGRLPHLVALSARRRFSTAPPALAAAAGRSVVPRGSHLQAPLPRAALRYPGPRPALLLASLLRRAAPHPANPTAAPRGGRGLALAAAAASPAPAPEPPSQQAPGAAMAASELQPRTNEDLEARPYASILTRCCFLAAPGSLSCLHRSFCLVQQRKDGQRYAPPRAAFHMQRPTHRPWAKRGPPELLPHPPSTGVDRGRGRRRVPAALRPPHGHV